MKCPKCGIRSISSEYVGAFECGTILDSGGVYHHTTTCAYICDILKPLNAHIKRLEKAGDAMARSEWAEDELADAWWEATEAKP